MTKRIPVPENLIVSTSAYLKNHNLGNRGIEDGSRRKQEIGLIGELVVYHYLLGNYPDLNTKTDGFDGGYDFIFHDKRIDVKTMERKTYVKPDFVNNFYLLQKDYQADIIVFCSYNNVDNVLEICGWLPKNELGTRGIFYAAGTKRIRSDGSTFIFRQDNYEVENRNLNDIDKLSPNKYK